MNERRIGYSAAAACALLAFISFITLQHDATYSAGAEYRYFEIAFDIVMPRRHVFALGDGNNLAARSLPFYRPRFHGGQLLITAAPRQSISSIYNTAKRVLIY